VVVLAAALPYESQRMHTVSEEFAWASHQPVEPLMVSFLGKKVQPCINQFKVASLGHQHFCPFPLCCQVGRQLAFAVGQQPGLRIASMHKHCTNLRLKQLTLGLCQHLSQKAVGQQPGFKIASMHKHCTNLRLKQLTLGLQQPGFRIASMHKKTAQI
jgi:hypothetical protein